MNQKDIALRGLVSALEIIDILPQVDVVEDLKTILEIQYELVNKIFSRKYFGKENLDIYTDFLDNIDNQIIRIKQSIKSTGNNE